MKTIFPILLFIVCLGIFTTGCTEHKEADKTPPAVDTIPNDRPDALANFRKSLAQLPLHDQKDVFTGLGPEMKSALWRNRLSELLTRPLTEEQKNLLLMAVERITPATYTPEGRKEFEVFIEEWKPKANTAFTDHAAFYKMVTMLDDDAVFAGKRDKCTCSTVSDYCPDDSPCLSSTGNCLPTMDGCGTFGWYACDGMCND